MLPVTTRASKLRQELNLYRRFIEMPAIWEDGRLCTLKIILHLISSWPFYKEKKRVGKGVGKKVNQMRVSVQQWFSWYFFKDFIYLFSETGELGETETREMLMWEMHPSISCLFNTPTRDLACNPGLCPDWESNWQPFDLQDNAQPNEPHQSELTLLVSLYLLINKSLSASTTVPSLEHNGSDTISTADPLGHKG